LAPLFILIAGQVVLLVRLQLAMAVFVFLRLFNVLVMLFVILLLIRVFWNVSRL